MDDDVWQVIKANAPYHMSFFIIVIFMGSFYLVNLILAIVAMSYDDCRKQDQDAAEEELAVSLSCTLSLLSVHFASSGFDLVFSVAADCLKTFAVSDIAETVWPCVKTDFLRYVSARPVML